MRAAADLSRAVAVPTNLIEGATSCGPSARPRPYGAQTSQLGDTDLKSQTLKTSPTTPLLYVGTFLIMAGLVLGGSWLTMQVARGLARISRGASALLAARRLADNPKNAFRAVSGLVLAVFVGSLLASIVPVINAAQTSLGGDASSLTDVLRAPFSAGPGSGLPAGEAAKLIAKLRGPGVTVLAVYNNPSFNPNPGPPPGPLGPMLGGGRVRFEPAVWASTTASSAAPA